MTSSPSTVPVVVTHGGAGGPRENDPGCLLAAEAGAVALRGGLGALEAAIRATVVLEDDPRFNAGTGSNYRMDGVTIEMDAAVMDHDLRFAAVAAIQRVKNPVRVAEQVLETPHMLLAGEGALAFARSRGFADFDPGSERARGVYERVRAFLRGGEAPSEGWKGVSPEMFWNFPKSAQQAWESAGGGTVDTVGAVARDAAGRCAAALSTGGTTVMMLGRIGDTPIIGAGLYAGPHGAVAATGFGEEIMRRVLSKQVYDWIEEGMGAQEAANRALALVPAEYTVGIIAVSAHDEGVADNRTMPRAVIRIED